MFGLSDLLVEFLEGLVDLLLFEFELFALFLLLCFEQFVVLDVGLFLLLEFDGLLLEDDDLFLQDVGLFGCSSGRWSQLQSHVFLCQSNLLLA